jgi:hypothetical protein
MKEGRLEWGHCGRKENPATSEIRTDGWGQDTGTESEKVAYINRIVDLVLS